MKELIIRTLIYTVIVSTILIVFTLTPAFINQLAVEQACSPVNTMWQELVDGFFERTLLFLLVTFPVAYFDIHGADKLFASILGQSKLDKLCFYLDKVIDWYNRNYKTIKIIKIISSILLIVLVILFILKVFTVPFC